MRTLIVRFLVLLSAAKRTLAALVVTLPLAPVALAQPNPADFELPAEEAEPLYHIELILFAFNEGNRFEEDLLHGLENQRFAPPLKLLRVPAIELETVFGTTSGQPFGLPGDLSPSNDPADTGDPADPADPANAIPEIDPLRDRLVLFERAETGNPEGAANTIALPGGFRPLTTDELEMTNVAARMDRRPYTLLGHAGWVQTGVDTDRSVALDLKFLGIDNPTGEIEVYARRYLHAIVDFDFHEGSGSFWTAPSSFGLAPFEYAQSFKVEEELNAIRSGDTPHYIDHPLYGVLIQIRRAPEPEDETGSQNAGGPAG